MMNIRRMISSKPLQLLLVGAVALTGLLLFQAPKVSAAANDNWGGIPQPVLDYLRGCDGSANEAAQAAWLSLRGDSLATVIDLPYGATTVDLQYNAVVYICSTGLNSAGNVNTSRVGTTFGIQSTNPDIPGLNGQSVTVPFGPAINDRYNVNVINFTYTFPPLTESTTLDVEVVFKAINHKSSGAFECVTIPGVPNNRIPNSPTDFGACNSEGRGRLLLELRVSSRPPVGDINSVNCSLIEGWAYDPDVPNDSIAVHIYVGGPAGSGAPGYAISADYDRPDVRNVFGIGGNHGFRLNTRDLAGGIYQAVSRDIYFYAIDAQGATNTFLGSRTMPAWLSDTCQPPTNFTASPTAAASLNPPGEDETPTSVNFGGNVTFSSSNRNVTVRVTRTFTRNGAPFAAPAVNDVTGNDAAPVNLSAGPYVVTVPISNPLPGDQFCTIVTIQPASGQLTYSGIQSPGPGAGPTASNGPVCATIVGRPYVKAFGDDVLVGGAFDDGGCTPPATSDLSTYARDADALHPFRRGASDEFAVQVMNVITADGFYSASQRTTYPAPRTGLTLASAGAWGGNFDGSFCATNWFTSTRRGTPIALGSVGALDVSGAQDPDPDRHYTLSYSAASNNTSAADVTLSASAGYASQHAFYVDGDVRISSNITYPGGTYTFDPVTRTFTGKPYFALIVYGNIYIDPGVSQLDGLYVAQPRAGRPDSGRVYTCAPNGSKPTNSTIGDCRTTQLVINGALYADTIKWGRTKGTVNRAAAAETPASDTAGPRNIAEVVNFRPDMYIGDLPFRQTGRGSSAGKYQFMASLPPIF